MPCNLGQLGRQGARLCCLPRRLQTDLHGFLVRLAHEGKPLCPIWQSPLFSSSVFKLDWLHVMDKGVGVFFMGGLVQYFCRQRFYGNNFEVRAAYLWDLIQTFYRREGVKDRFEPVDLQHGQEWLKRLSSECERRSCNCSGCPEPARQARVRVEAVVSH